MDQYNGLLSGAFNSSALMGIMDMGNPFQIFGPFEVDKLKVANKAYQKTFWSERDEGCPKLSDANGVYLFSLRNGSNYKPQYVGITKRDFRRECFNSSNLVKILDRFANEKGTLFLHLLAKPKDHNAGFLTIRSKTLLWTEMFLLLLCRNKNPEILNIAGHKFLEDCGLEGVTYPSKGKGKPIKTFRNALGVDIIFGIAAGGGRTKPIPKPIPQPTAQPTAQPTPQPTLQTTQPTTQTTQPGKTA